MLACEGTFGELRCRLRRRRYRHRGGGQRRTEGVLDGRFFQHVQRPIRCVIPGQCGLLGAAFACPLGAAQRLQLPCLGAGAALVDVQVALQFLALAAARAVAVQQPLHPELTETLAVVVQGLATEPEYLGQPRLVDPVLQ
jgi:hypothetical protein